MSKLDKIFDRVVPPVPWDEGDNIPWDDPDFSERMLAEHLSQDHDLASRKTATIARHARWIFEELLGSEPARVLDLACGPGLYTCALAELGCRCVGVDFSPASIRHADETATAGGLPCTHLLADVRRGGFGDGFDLAMMIYGQINVFTPEQVPAILRDMSRSLKPGGTLLLEPQTLAQVRGGGTQSTSWYTAERGLFAAQPHLVLQESYWDEASSTRTERFFVVGVEGSVERHVLSTVAYEDGELEKMISAAGFENVRAFPSLLGRADEEHATTRVLVATKGE